MATSMAASMANTVNHAQAANNGRCSDDRMNTFLSKYIRHSFKNTFPHLYFLQNVIFGRKCFRQRMEANYVYKDIMCTIWGA